MSTDFRLGPCPIFVEGLFEVLNRIDPVNYCDDINACGTNYLPSSNNFMVKNNLRVPDAPFCDICTDVVKQVKTQLEDPRLIDDIHRKVDAFCEYLTVVDADKQCRAALQSYIDQALDYVKKVQPTDFCRSLQFCSAQPVVRFASTRPKKEQTMTLPTLVDFNNFGLETSAQIGGQQSKSVDDSILRENVGIKSPTCLFCKTLVKEVFKFLKNNKTEENIRNTLDHACTLIYHGQDKRDHCEDLVKAYSKEFVELLVDETDPQVICMLLDQCTYQTMPTTQTRRPVVELSVIDKIIDVLDSLSSKSSQFPPEDKPITMSQLISMLDPTIHVDSMRTCIECKLFFKYLQENIQEPKKQEEIKDWLLSNLCANLGDLSIAESCTKFINQESAVFFKAVAESIDPKKSCEQLGACSARIRSDYLAKLQQQLVFHRELEPTKISTGPLCNQCTQIVARIDAYISTHPIDHDISVLKDKVCNAVQDDNLRDECVMIIQTFGQEIIQAISYMDNPQQLCQKIRLC